MRFFRQKEAGVTLLELVLILVISASITMAGLKLVSYFNQDNMLRKAQFNVEQLFQGVGMYYRSNCNGSLSPVNNTPAVTTLTIASLVTNGYLVNWNPQVNTVVDTTTFTMQLEPYSASRIPSGGMTYNNWVITPPFKTSFTSAVGLINFWVVHIAVKLQTGFSPAVYQARLFATCSANAPGTLCSSSPAAGPYLIWERLPGLASPRTASDLKWTMPRIRAFTNLYNTDDMYGAYNPAWGTSPPASTAGNYYLCGG